MSDIVERLRLDAEPTEGDMETAAQEIEKLRAENAKFAASNHAYLSDYQEARGEIEKLRKAILDALKLADLDAIKSFRKTLLMALREKE
jgi:hypothetical protein